jgi:hypothetical protein
MGDGDRRRAATDRSAFDAFVASRAATLAPEVTGEKFSERYAAIWRAIGELQQAFREAAPDVVVTFGDDQREVFSTDHTAAIDIFTGASVIHGRPTSPRLSRSQSQPDWRRAAIRQEFPAEPTEYPGDEALATHLVSSLTASGFDVSYTATLREDQEFSHAFGFVTETLMNGVRVPQVPVMVNTYYPPNQPTAQRCYQLGQAVRKAIDEWDSSKRVLLVASGGLSHTMIDESLDRQVLDAMRDKRPDVLTSIPEKVLVGGTSEIKNWIALYGAMETDPRSMRLVDYVPMYRSLAGTGVGAGFAIWE